MTLIIGVTCDDGIVIGADGAATLTASTDTSPLEFTVQQPTSKLHIHENQLIVGTAGAIGLGQRISDEVHSLYRKHRKFSNVNEADMMRFIREKTWLHIKQELDIAKEAAPAYGNAVFVNATCDTLIAFPLDNRIPTLIVLDGKTASPEIIRGYHFLSIGSGTIVSDPIMSLIKKVFWPNRKPNLPQGIFAVMWAIQHAIHCSPLKIAEPVSICTLSKKDSLWKALELDSNDLEEMRFAINEVEKHLGTFSKPAKSST